MRKYFLIYRKKLLVIKILTLKKYLYILFLNKFETLTSLNKICFYCGFLWRRPYSTGGAAVFDSRGMSLISEFHLRTLFIA